MRRETAREGPLAAAARALLPIALAVPALLAARGPFLDAQESAVSATGAGQTPGARSPGAAPAGVVDVPLTAGPRQPDGAIAPAAGDTITLEEAVGIAVSRSPQIREAEGARLASKASSWDSWGRLMPSLSASTGFTRGDVLQRTSTDPVTGGIVTLPESLITSQRTYDTQTVVSADWTVFDGGRTYWDIRQASAESEAGDFAFDAARARVAADVKLAYLDALEAVALEGTRRADLERARGLAEVAAARFQVGEVPELDDLQARLSVSDAEIALLEAETATDAARLALFEDLALGADADVTLIEPATPSRSELPSEAELRELALTESAELASLRATREAAERGLDEEKWWFLPSVTVGADWVRTEFGQTTEAITLEPRNTQTFYRLGLSWVPLRQPGGLVADRRRARAGLWTAQGRLAAREAALAREVEVALGRLRRARLLQEKSVMNVDLGRRQREQAAERYRLGLAPIVEQLTAEALAAEAERQAITARYATLRALAELERAAGIRWTSNGGAASPL